MWPGATLHILHKRDNDATNGDINTNDTSMLQVPPITCARARKLNHQVSSLFKNVMSHDETIQP